jgi:hypothetical protein
LNEAPSPAETYSARPGPNTRSPVEWLGYCWHQSVISGVSTPPGASRDSRPDTTQPSAVAPGGVGQESGQRGNVLRDGSLLYV